jgi:hypothetical protein
MNATASLEKVLAGPIPSARIDYVANCKTRWIVDFPAVGSKPAKSYYVSTYPNSELIFVEAYPSLRVVPQGVASKLTAAIREAISRAQAAESDQPGIPFDVFRKKVAELGGWIEGEMAYFQTVHAKQQFENWMTNYKTL